MNYCPCQNRLNTKNNCTASYNSTQRSRLCEVREFVARQPGCDVSYKTQFKNLQKYFLINGQPKTKVQYSYQSLVIAGQARILQNRMLYVWAKLIFLKK